MKVLDVVKDTYLIFNDESLVVRGVKGFEGLMHITFLHPFKQSLELLY